MTDKHQPPKKSLLYNAIIILLVIMFLGAYQEGGQLGDLWVMLILGVVGWIMKESGVPRAPFLIGFVLAIVVASFCGYLVGLLSFRVRGAYFVIVTISFAEVVRLVALNWVELTQGPLALTNIPSITIGLPGLGDLTLRTKLQNYYLVLAVAVIAYVLIARLVHSHFGRTMRGLMENETLAVSVGIDVTKTLTLAAVISVKAGMNSTETAARAAAQGSRKQMRSAGLNTRASIAGWRRVNLGDILPGGA